MKNFVFILFLLPLFVIAQDKPLLVEGSGADLHVKHTTGPKESFYSIGRIYNISPKIMAPYNQLILEKGLTIGQVVKIPLNDINFSQNGVIAEDEALIPLFYKVKPKETLNLISNNTNKIAVATLKKWNKLSSDAVPVGKNMVIGFLKVKKELSPLAKNAVTVEPIASTDNIPTAVPSAVTETPVQKEVAKVEPPLVKKEVVKTESEIKKADPIPVKTAPVTSKSESKGRDMKGGAFMSLFQKLTAGKKLQEQQGTAGTFKSTSGWEDGKYYCLHNTALAGTVIKITNPVNQRSVYAKVLDVIPDLKQNEGMVIRVSNAAADELGVITDNFTCTLNF